MSLNAHLCLAINGDSYTDNCLAKNECLTFEIHQKTLDVYFGHTYNKRSLLEKAVQFLKDQNIKFVPKPENPPNTPEIRFIEDFWSFIKGEVYKDVWEAENFDQLRNRIVYCFEKVDREWVQELAESTQRRSDTITRCGLVEMR